MLSIPFPRVLPLTIVALAALLGMKVLVLVGLVSADPAVPLLAAGGMVARANAASPPADASAPAAAADAAKMAPEKTEAEKTEAEKTEAEKTEAEKPAAAKTAAEKMAAEKTAHDKTAPGKTASGATAPVPVAAPPDPPPVSDSERAVLLDLRRRRQELDARENGVAAREAMLGAAENRLGARITELTALQTKLEGLERARREREESNWKGLVKIYEDMRPRDAATIFNGLEMTVLLEVLDRMKEARTAPILAAMQPDKARQATADLAEKRLKNNSIGG